VKKAYGMEHWANRFTRSTAVLLAALLGAVSTHAYAQDITIGEGLAVGWGQFFVADQSKGWEKQGLSPKVTTFPSGRLVLDALVGGGVVIGTAAENAGAVCKSQWITRPRDRDVEPAGVV
jgi:ABC-type taurine transport system substrate-binding protein